MKKHTFDDYMNKLIEIKKLTNTCHFDIEKYTQRIKRIENEVKDLIRSGKGNSISYGSYIKEIDNITDSLYEENESYQQGKQTILMQILDENDKLLKKKKELDNSYQEENKKIKNLRVNLLAKWTRIAAGFVLFQLVGSLIGGGLAALVYKKYKVTTKTYNLETPDIISEENIDYERSQFNYQVNVKVYSKWEEKSDKTGYIRTVLEYDQRENDEEKSIDVENLVQTINPTYYQEEKETLDSSDNTENTEIIVTETTMDKSESIPSKTHVISYLIWGAIYFTFFVCGDYAKDKYQKYDCRLLAEQLKDAKVTLKRIKEEYVDVGGKVLTLQDEYRVQTCKYSDLVADINPELLETAKKYVK